MSNLLIAGRFISDDATVTCATAATAGPAINLQRDQPTDVLESSTLTPAIVIDMGAVVAFNLIALLFTNALSTATWRIRTADSEAALTGGSPTYDSTVVDFSSGSTADTRRRGFLWSSTGWTNRWIRIDIDDTGNPAGVFYAGRLIIDNAYQPSRNMAYGVAYGFIDTSARDRTLRGNTIVNAQGIIPTLSFDIRLDNEAEFYANTFQMQQVRGGSRPFLIITEPDHATLAHEKMYYGLLSPTLRTTNDTYNIFTQRFELEGMI